MSTFWPDGIEITDIESPAQILQSAQKEWGDDGKGVMSLGLLENQNEDRITYSVIAIHVSTDRSALLFKVIHRTKSPYPVTIQPKEEEPLPNILKKSYYEPGTDIMKPFGASMAAMAALQALGSSEGRQVKNAWVADTPSEFRVNLKKAFNLGVVKGEMLNLVSTPKIGSDEEEGIEERTIESEDE